MMLICFITHSRPKGSSTLAESDYYFESIFTLGSSWEVSVNSKVFHLSLIIWGHAWQIVPVPICLQVWSIFWHIVLFIVESFIRKNFADQNKSIQFHSKNLQNCKMFIMIHFQHYFTHKWSSYGYEHTILIVECVLSGDDYSVGWSYLIASLIIASFKSNPRSEKNPWLLQSGL